MRIRHQSLKVTKTLGPFPTTPKTEEPHNPVSAVRKLNLFSHHDNLINPYCAVGFGASSKTWSVSTLSSLRSDSKSSRPTSSSSKLGSPPLPSSSGRCVWIIAVCDWPDRSWDKFVIGDELPVLCGVTVGRTGSRDCRGSDLLQLTDARVVDPDMLSSLWKVMIQWRFPPFRRVVGLCWMPFQVCLMLKKLGLWQFRSVQISSQLVEERMCG